MRTMITAFLIKMKARRKARRLARMNAYFNKLRNSPEEEKLLFLEKCMLEAYMPACFAFTALAAPNFVRADFTEKSTGDKFRLEFRRISETEENASKP